ncbi:hypothetical protein ACOME3_001164 [Neoechinorhynchus agilis]
MKQYFASECLQDFKYLQYVLASFQLSRCSLNIPQVQPLPQVSKRIQMRLPIIPRPEYFDNLVRSQIESGQLYLKETNLNIKEEKCKSRNNSVNFVREPYNLRSGVKRRSDLLEFKENSNSTAKRRKIRKNKTTTLYESSNISIAPATNKTKTERLDFNLLGPLHRECKYRCSKCPKCRRPALEEINYQRGQCGYRSCGFEYCNLCWQKYHPCQPCIDGFNQDDFKNCKKGRLGRC